MKLPISEIQGPLLKALKTGSVVVTAPTGTGKSTEIPRWLLGPDTGTLKSGGFILAIQPRRVAARAVASRIAELEGLTVGGGVGYRVRDDDKSSDSTKLLVVTPGIVLSRPELLSQAAVVVLDELHERRLDTDLILALMTQNRQRFIAMSATLDGDQVAARVHATHLSVSARNHPVEISYRERGPALPEATGIEQRVLRAMRDCQDEPGDVLVFLPGRAEIQRTCDTLSQLPYEIVPLHGSLSLKEQARALRPSEGGFRRIIVTTNVAETSLTIPSVRTVIDSGLVRRTTYHNGRSYLALSNVAIDSADQRAGRAGRTAPGKCIRLWGRQAKLLPATPPEIHRESLIPLVMTCAALEEPVHALPFLDPPHDFALEDARERLMELRAIVPGAPGESDTLTKIGVALRGLPVDAWLSRFLVEARERACLEDAICLVAALEQPNPSAWSQSMGDESMDHPHCDAEALIRAARQATANGRGPERDLARSRARLCKAFRLPVASPAADALLDRERLLACIVAADPKSAHIARVRKTRITFSNGGTELDLSRQSRPAGLQTGTDAARKAIDALVVLETRGIANASQDKKLLITLASPVTLGWLGKLGLGSLLVKDARIEKKGPQRGQLLVVSTRVLAGRTLCETETSPQGSAAREAIAQLFLAGTLHRKSMTEARRRLERRSLAATLGQNRNFPFFEGSMAPPSLKDWLILHLEELGVDAGDDLKLLSAEDFLPDDVPAELAPQLDEHFPLEVDVGDCRYQVAYDLTKKQVTLSVMKGQRRTPPPASYLPKFQGFRVFVEAGGSFHPVRR